MSSSGSSRLATWRDAVEREGEVLKYVMTDNEGAKREKELQKHKCIIWKLNAKLHLNHK